MADPTDEGDRDEAEAKVESAEESAEAARPKAKKRSGKGRSKGVKAKEQEEAKVAAAPNASGDRAGYLVGHAVIWLGVLGSVAYFMAKGR